MKTKDKTKLGLCTGVWRKGKYRLFWMVVAIFCLRDYEVLNCRRFLFKEAISVVYSEEEEFKNLGCYIIRKYATNGDDGVSIE